MRAPRGEGVRSDPAPSFSAKAREAHGGLSVLYHNVQVMAHALRFIDAGAVAAAAWFAVWLGLGGDASHRGEHLAALLVFSGALFLAFLVVAERFRLYLARRTEDLLKELWGLAEATFYAAGIACVVSLSAGEPLPGHSYFHALAGCLVAVVGLRFLMRVTARRLRRRGGDYRVWLIVGHNDRAAEIAETILANPHFGIRIEEIVNMCANEVAATIPSRFDVAPLSGVRRRVVASSEAVREIVATKVIDEVVVTLPVRSCYDQIREVLDICCEAGISVKFGTEVFKNAGVSTHVAYIGSVPMVTHYSGPSNYRLLTLKRLIDFFGAAVGLALMSPVLLAVAIGVKATSPGSVLFRQTRVGLHGRHFQMLKFRSMRQDAAQMRSQLASANQRDGTAFKVKNDARITPLGRYLRKYRLDELPQLWNVLVGDMSLVGPRPLPVAEAFGDEWWQRRRLSMPPGLTCFWQLADDPLMPFQKWMQLDMEYIDRWSLWLDFKLIARTFGMVARGNGW